MSQGSKKDPGFAKIKRQRTDNKNPKKRFLRTQQRKATKSASGIKSDENKLKGHTQQTTRRHNET